MSDKAKQVVAAVDASPYFEPVVRRAQKLADCLDASLTVLHVMSDKTPSMANEFSYGDLVLGGYDNEVLVVEERIKQAFEDRLRNAGLTEPELLIVAGSPARTISDYLDEHDAALLVVGQPKAHLGSVATKLVKRASCDVYICRVGQVD